MRMRGDPGMPLPASFEEAWENCWSRVYGVPPGYYKVMRQIFYVGGGSALDQANAGRYVQTATALNDEIFKRAGLTLHEVIEVTDALLDGTYDLPPGYSATTPFKSGLSNPDEEGPSGFRG